MAARILVIDDDAHLRETVRMALETEGYDVTTAASGEEGLRQFGDGTGWNLVLVDYRLGGPDGDVVARRLHLLSAGVPVLMLTGHASIELQSAILGSGAMGMLLKPIRPDQLRQTVRRVLANWQPPAAPEEDEE